MWQVQVSTLDVVCKLKHYCHRRLNELPGYHFVPLQLIFTVIVLYKAAANGGLFRFPSSTFYCVYQLINLFFVCLFFLYNSGYNDKCFHIPKQRHQSLYCPSSRLLEITQIIKLRHFFYSSVSRLIH